MKSYQNTITAPIFNIQSYSIHDGPGIRVTVFVKGCPLRCLWCANPESNLSKPQLMTYASKCTGCGSCVTTCPNGALSIEAVDGGAKAVTDRKKCSDCGQCVSVCPADAREMSGEEMTVQEMKQYVLDHMAKHKVPKYIEFVDGFPMNDAGKIQKYKMREQAIQKLGLQKDAAIETA